jgi:hypothetical protein
MVGSVVPVNIGLQEEICVIITVHWHSAASEQPKSATTKWLDGGAFLLRDHAHRPTDPRQRQCHTRDRPGHHRFASPLSCSQAWGNENEG